MQQLARPLATAVPLCRRTRAIRASAVSSPAFSIRLQPRTRQALLPRSPPAHLRVSSLGRQLLCRASSEPAIVVDEEKNIAKLSFGTIGLGVGSVLLVLGFLGYFNFLKGLDNSLSALLLIYGFPITLIGFALKYAELQPLSCVSYANAVALREKEATPILLQIRNDVTRYRYGDEQHLEEALDRIFRVGKSGGIRRNQSPVLTRLREEVVDGHYALVLGFESPNLVFTEWETRQPKIQGFFGPGVRATLKQLEGNAVEVALISDGTAAGVFADDEQDILPPLMPGLPARVVKKNTK